MAAVPAWTSINATCVDPPPNWHVSLAQIIVPEPYIYVTNLTGNNRILERCAGSPAVNYVDNTMPADAIGCFLVAHVEKGSANEAWQCFIDGRMEGQWGISEKDKSNDGMRKSAGAMGWMATGLIIVGAVFARM